MMPAYYLMATSAIGAVAIYFLQESAQRPLPGSMPSVDTQEEARELVATQDDNPLLDMDYAAVRRLLRAGHARHRHPDHGRPPRCRTPDGLRRAASRRRSL